MKKREQVRIADPRLPGATSRPTSVSPSIDYEEASDEELLMAARSSDEGAFAELSSRHRNLIHNTASRIVRHYEDAEDVVQDTLFKAYIHLESFQSSSLFSTWLTRIAINTSLMLLRKRRTRSEVSSDHRGDEDSAWRIWELADKSPNPEQTYDKLQTNDLLSQAIMHLPPAYGIVLTQYHDHQQSLQQIAENIGITAGAAKSRLQRARLRVRSTLEKSGVSKQTLRIGRPVRSKMHHADRPIDVLEDSDTSL